MKIPKSLLFLRGSGCPIHLPFYGMCIYSGMASTMKDQNAPGEYRCGICGLTFAGQNNKDKHIELEHKGNKRPAGVR